MPVLIGITPKILQLHSCQIELWIQILKTLFTRPFFTTLSTGIEPVMSSRVTRSHISSHNASCVSSNVDMPLLLNSMRQTALHTRDVNNTLQSSQKREMEDVEIIIDRDTIQETDVHVQTNYRASGKTVQNVVIDLKPPLHVDIFVFQIHTSVGILLSRKDSSSRTF